MSEKLMPRDDLISRSGLLDELYDFITYNDNGEQEINADLAIHAVQNAKSVHLRAERTGRWVRTGESRPEAVCSNCGAEVRYQAVDGRWKFEPYCAHCGFRMIGGEEDATD